LKSERTHDKFYLDENRYNEPKEMFKFVANKAFSQESRESNFKIADFGCAAGEFLFYLNQMLSDASLFGIDILPELLEKCSRYVPEAKLKEGSILDSDIHPENYFDKTFLLGVHSIFDEFETCLNNLIKFTKPGGGAYVFGMFNPFPVDVIIKYKESENFDRDVFESGWNIFSQKSVSLFLVNHPKVKSFSFIPFEMKVSLTRQQDIIRSWTIQDSTGNNLITNGLCIVQPIFLLEIQL
jgi:SAM-dependent methyltransferase